jgi:hypothetical protein
MDMMLLPTKQKLPTVWSPYCYYSWWNLVGQVVCWDGICVLEWESVCWNGNLCAGMEGLREIEKKGGVLG